MKHYDLVCYIRTQDSDSALANSLEKEKVLGHGSARITLWFILCKFLSTLFVTSAYSGKDLYYRGSVVECTHVVLSRFPMLNINMTIDAMETYIRRASEDTADIIVFPSNLWTFGLVAPGNSTIARGPLHNMERRCRLLVHYLVMTSVHNIFCFGSNQLSCQKFIHILNTVDVLSCPHRS